MSNTPEPQASLTASDCLSTASTAPAEIGLKPTNVDDLLTEALRVIWKNSVRVKGDYARKYAHIIAMAASMQMITTKVGDGIFAHAWHITGRGLQWIKEHEAPSSTT